jgi:hypothetical protein
MDAARRTRDRDTLGCCSGDSRTLRKIWIVYRLAASKIASALAIASAFAD